MAEGVILGASMKPRSSKLGMATARHGHVRPIGSRAIVMPSRIPAALASLRGIRLALWTDLDASLTTAARKRLRVVDGR